MTTQADAIKLCRPLLKTLPKYERKSFSTWRSEYKVWFRINGISDAGVEFAKQSILMCMVGEKARMCEGLQVDTDAYNAIDTADKFLEALELVFSPQAESELSKELFKSYKQGRKEDISSYLSKKYSLYDRAYPEAERSFTTLLDYVIQGVYSPLVKRKLRFETTTNRVNLREKAIFVVATLRRCYNEGYGEATSLDGLAATTQVFSFTESGEEPMEVDSLRDEINAIKNDERRCYKCNRTGHLAKTCRVPKKNYLPGKNVKHSDKKEFRGKCNYCSKVGHIAKDCYAKKNESKRSGKSDPGKGAQRDVPNHKRVNKIENEDDEKSFLEEVWEEEE